MADILVLLSITIIEINGIGEIVEWFQQRMQFLVDVVNAIQPPTVVKLNGVADV